MPTVLPYYTSGRINNVLTPIPVHPDNSHPGPSSKFLEGAYDLQIPGPFIRSHVLRARESEINLELTLTSRSVDQLT